MGMISKAKQDPIYRARLFLGLTTAWTGLLFVYNALLGYYGVEDKNGISWYSGLAFWFGVLFIVKVIISAAAGKMVKGKKHIDFFQVIKVYYFINMVEILLIVITPLFFTSMFGQKLTKGLTISSLIINSINIFLFLSSWIRVKKSSYPLPEYRFLMAKKYLGRTESFFNILTIVLNILILTKQSSKVLSYTYLGIGMGFVIYSLIMGIALAKHKIS